MPQLLTYKRPDALPALEVFPQPSQPGIPIAWESWHCFPLRASWTVSLPQPASIKHQ